jgi:1,2-diacylglycerol 3-alpha-glucosyltransferase
LTNIELAGSWEIYRTLIKSREKRFDNITLFEGQELMTIPFRSMWPALVKALKDLKPDVIFTSGYSWRLMRRVASWARKNCVAVSLISDSNIFDTHRYRALEWLKSLYVSRYDAAFVGGTSSSLYLQHLGFPRDRIVLGYDVIDNDFFRSRADAIRRDLLGVRKRHGLPGESFLFVGRLIPQKNLKGLLEAYLLYINGLRGIAPWPLLICGEGPGETELRSLINTMPSIIGDLVQFRGPVSQSDLPDYLSGASCFVLPSKTESWGLVVNEAMACGLPVLISNRCGCASDLVQNGVNGWQFDPDQIGRLAELMRVFHDMSPQERAEMGRRGEEIISAWGLERFSTGGLNAAMVAFRHKLKAGGTRTA